MARLGENDLRGWWQGHALDRTGRYVLSGMFRRTWRPAALELDMAAATRMHNELLGRPTALHLFSDLLPFRRWAAGWLAEQKTSEETDPLLSTLEAWTAETALESMRAWSGQSQGPRGEPLGEGLLLGRMTAIELADPQRSSARRRYLQPPTSTRPGRCARPTSIWPADSADFQHLEGRGANRRCSSPGRGVGPRARTQHGTCSRIADQNLLAKPSRTRPTP